MSPRLVLLSVQAIAASIFRTGIPTASCAGQRVWSAAIGECAFLDGTAFRGLPAQMRRTMTTQLRPMGLGEILDRTAELYRNHFLLVCRHCRDFFRGHALDAVAAPGRAHSSRLSEHSSAPGMGLCLGGRAGSARNPAAGRTIHCSQQPRGGLGISE